MCIKMKLYGARETNKLEISDLLEITQSGLNPFRNETLHMLKFVIFDVN